VQRALGSLPDPARLGEVARLVLGPNDRLYAVDRRTGCVHVFEADGRRAFVCRTEPREFADETGPPWLTVDDAGEARLFCAAANSLLVFGPDGARRAVLPLADDDAQRWRLPQPGAGRSWVLGGGSLRLVDAHGQLLRWHARTPDDR